MPTLSQPEDHSLKTVVPQIAEVLKGGMEVLNGNLDAVSAGIDALKSLTKKRLVLSWEDISTDASTPLPLASIFNSSSVVSRPPGSSTSTNTVRLSRVVTTVVDLWKEYSSGIAGKMPIAEANQRFGSKWRQHPTEARFYLRRKKYYDAVTTVSTRDKITLEAAAEQLEGARLRAGLSLNAFAGKLKDLTETRSD